MEIHSVHHIWPIRLTGPYRRRSRICDHLFGDQGTQNSGSQEAANSGVCLGIHPAVNVQLLAKRLQGEECWLSILAASILGDGERQLVRRQAEPHWKTA